MDFNPEQEGINAAHKMMRISRIHLDIGNIPAAIEDCSDYNIFTSASLASHLLRATRPSAPTAGRSSP